MIKFGRDFYFLGKENGKATECCIGLLGFLNPSSLYSPFLARESLFSLF